MKYCPQCASLLALKIIDGVERKACSQASINISAQANTKECSFVDWNNPTPVAAALIEINGKYLLARNHAWPEGFFSLISGFIEAGESPEISIEREVMEEVGLKAVSTHFIGHFPFPAMNQLIIAFGVKAEGEIQLNEELLEYKLLSKEELANYDFDMLKLGRFVADKWAAQLCS
jgi:NAD+ diphosphatase